jgi:hypothetical protein
MSSSWMCRCVVLAGTDVSEECRFLQESHDGTSQKMTFFIVTAMKTSNLTLTDTVFFYLAWVWENIHGYGILAVSYIW